MSVGLNLLSQRPTLGNSLLRQWASLAFTDNSLSPRLNQLSLESAEPGFLEKLFIRLRQPTRFPRLENQVWAHTRGEQQGLLPSPNRDVGMIT